MKASSLLLAVMLLALTTADQISAAVAPAATVLSHSRPEDWDLSVFLPVGRVQDVMAPVVGQSITLPEERGTVTIEALQLATANRQATLNLTLLVTTGTPAVQARLKAMASLRQEGPINRDEPLPRVPYIAAIDSVLTAEGTLSAGVDTAKLNLALKETLTFLVPAPVDLTLPLRFNDKLTFESGQGGRVILNVEAMGTTISQKATHLTTVFVPSGIWCCVDYERPATPQVLPAPSASVPADPYADYEQKGGTSAQIVVKGDFLASLINELGNKPETERTAHVSVVEHSGSLAYQKWSDNTLGKGGIDVWLENNDGHADVSIKPAAKWTPEGLKIDCDYTAKAVADLHVHVDPLISGGIGTSVGCKGESSGKFSATMTLKLTSNENGSSLSLVPLIDAGQNLALTAKSDGTCKIGGILGISLSVPEVGAKVFLPVPQDILGSFPLIDSTPHHLLKAGTVTSPDKSLYLTFIPLETSWRNENGYAVRLDMKVESLTAREVTQRKAAAEAAQLKTSKPKLEVGSISILLGALEFGKGNEFIKIAMKVVDAVQAGITTAENVGREVGRFGTNTGREVSRAARNVDREVQIAGKNVERELGRAADNTAKTLDKAADDVAREAKAAAKGVESNVKKAGSWIKKSFGF